MPESLGGCLGAQFSPALRLACCPPVTIKGAIYHPCYVLDLTPGWLNSLAPALGKPP